MQRNWFDRYAYVSLLLGFELEFQIKMKETYRVIFWLEPIFGFNITKLFVFQVY